MRRLRIDAQYDILPAIKNILETTDYIYTGCINCINFNQTLEVCKLANQRPPAKVICFGCPKWEYDGIPF